MSGSGLTPVIIRDCWGDLCWPSIFTPMAYLMDHCSVQWGYCPGPMLRAAPKLSGVSPDFLSSSELLVSFYTMGSWELSSVHPTSSLPRSFIRKPFLLLDPYFTFHFFYLSSGLIWPLVESAFQSPGDDNLWGRISQRSDASTFSPPDTKMMPKIPQLAYLSFSLLVLNLQPYIATWWFLSFSLSYLSYMVYLEISNI
jgi:hypothetical protein